MRSTSFIAVLVIWVALGVAPRAAAQNAAPPTIHNVTLQEGAGVLTITGIGFGREPVVTVDGQPVAVLPGGKDTQVAVVAPAALLTTPGTYRLTVVDPVRQVGDAFVVASQAATVALGGAALNGTPAALTASGTVPAMPPAVGPAASAATRSLDAPAPLVIEDAGSPYRTAIGAFALASNTTGSGNTASGWGALRFNTTGSSNTATGLEALYSNTAGINNTASGYLALASNTTGSYNTASGRSTLYFNSTGSFNTASGLEALYSNTLGTSNTASGYAALHANTTGNYNTASGYEALYSNITGSNNMASGFLALVSNTTGSANTASGRGALYFNSTGYSNTASGYLALANNTTGVQNTASGADALYFNTTGNYNTASGWGALQANTTGGFNAALGFDAGSTATTGSYNLFLGAEVVGTAADTNTIRIGLPYSGGVGQNQTFIAGIYGAKPSAGLPLPVVIDANGQLGTMARPLWWNPIPPSANAPALTLEDARDRLAAVIQQLQDQEAMIADLSTQVEALLSAAGHK
jgi:hypothetical protein